MKPTTIQECNEIMDDLVSTFTHKSTPAAICDEIRMEYSRMIEIRENLLFAESFHELIDEMSII